MAICSIGECVGEAEHERGRRNEERDAVGITTETTEAERARRGGTGREKEVTGPAVYRDNTSSFQPVCRGKVTLPSNCAFWAGAQMLEKRPICATVPELISPGWHTTASSVLKPWQPMCKAHF